MSVRESLIDLGEVTPGRPYGAAVRSPRPPRAYRSVLAVLTVALLASLGGAAHVAPPAPPKIIPARLGDTTFVTGDRLFVVTGPGLPAGQVQHTTINTYALPSGSLLGRTTVAVTGAIFDVTEVSGVVLVSYQLDEDGAETTVAIAAGTDRAIWRRPARLLGISRSRGQALLRDSSPEYGPVRWYSVDLATGAERWSLRQPAAGEVTPADFGDPAPGTVGDGYPRRLVSVDLAGRMIVRDAFTGAILAARTIPVPDDWSRRGIVLWPDGDLVLVGDHLSAIAYALSDLSERWRAPVDLYSSYVGGDCARVVCLFNPRGGGVRILDRATGRQLWTSQRLSYAAEVGTYLIAASGTGASPNVTLDVIDVATGRLRGTFGPWQALGVELPGGELLGMRSQPVTDAVWYARLDPATLASRILGEADDVSGDCQTTTQVLICRRLDASVGIWRLTGGG